jgi:hypothetical protein
MNTKKLSAGDIIESRCTKCREILNHRIVAMVGEKVVRVECNTCGGTHNYYPPPVAKTPRTAGTAPAKKAAAPRTPKKDPGSVERDEWNSLRPSMNYDKAISYNMNAAFKKGDLINHPVFGYGFVKLVIIPNKMQVLFEDGIKLLRCS